MIITSLFLLLGLLILWKGTTSFVTGSLHLGRLFKLPTFIVGLSTVAFSSLLPNLIFCVVALENDRSGLMISSLLGNTMVNLTLLLALAGFTGTSLYQTQLRKNLLFCLAAFIFLGVLLLKSNAPQLNLMTGSLLLVGFFIYLGFLLKSKDTVIPVTTDQALPFWKALILFCLGLTVIPIGSILVINKALQLSQATALPIALIGLLPISLGLALPEIAAIITTFRSKKESLTFRSLTGAVMTNTIGLLGVLSLLKPMTFPSYFYNELGGLSLVTLLSVLFLSFSERNTLSKTQSALLVFLYLLYAASLFYRVF